MPAAKSLPIEIDLADRLKEAVARAGFELPEGARIEIEVPRESGRGDWASAVPLSLAKAAKRPPRDVAVAIQQAFEADPGVIDRIEIAGPGFLNFHLSAAWLHRMIRDILASPDTFGATDAGRGERILVEYVSANPTGPLNVVSARAASFGDALVRLLRAAGYAADGEFYVNDWGNQAELFGASVRTRFIESHGGAAPPIPEEGYAGAYVSELAATLDVKEGQGWLALDEAGQRSRFGAWGIGRMVASQQAALERFGVRMDRWYPESDLHTSGALDRAFTRLEAAGHVADKDGARWFKGTDFGDQEDRVLVRSNGTPTYSLADAAYHQDKFDRGYHRLIDILGPDHHSHVVRIKGLVEALGHEPDQLEVILLQWVKLMRGGEIVKMSKRAGDFISMDELVDEVGVDAARFFFLMRRGESPLDFDMELAAKRTEENPVYYVQYAHARIMHVLDYARGQGAAEPRPETADLSKLAEPEAVAVLRSLAGFPSLVAMSARTHEPHRIASYLKDLAATFHAFYHNHRVVTGDAPLTEARLVLTAATGAVLRRALGLLGVSAPEAM